MAFRYTRQQKASPFFEEYKKERARLQRFARSAKARGIDLPYDFVPDVPKTITAGSVRRLQRITPEHGYFEHAEYMRVNPESGEIIFKQGSQTAISRAISTVRQRQQEGETWVTSIEANKYLPPRRKDDLATNEYSVQDIITKGITPETIDTTPQDELDESGDYWYEDTYEPDDSDYDYGEPEESETDSDFDKEFDSDYNDKSDRLSFEKQIERVDEYISNTIDFIGYNVSPYLADAVSDMVASFKSATSPEGWASLMDDEKFWDDIASLVEEYYKSKKDPMPEVFNRISSRLANRPMTMEENSRYEEYINDNDSESYGY